MKPAKDQVVAVVAVDSPETEGRMSLVTLSREGRLHMLRVYGEHARWVEIEGPPLDKESR